jgi:hypothetical protein
MNQITPERIEAFEGKSQVRAIQRSLDDLAIQNSELKRALSNLQGGGVSASSAGQSQSTTTTTPSTPSVSITGVAPIQVSSGSVRLDYDPGMLENRSGYLNVKRFWQVDRTLDISTNDSAELGYFTMDRAGGEYKIAARCDETNMEFSGIASVNCTYNGTGGVWKRVLWDRYDSPSNLPITLEVKITNSDVRYRVVYGSSIWNPLDDPYLTFAVLPSVWQLGDAPNNLISPAVFPCFSPGSTVLANLVSDTATVMYTNGYFINQYIAGQLYINRVNVSNFSQVISPTSEFTIHVAVDLSDTPPAGSDGVRLAGVGGHFFRTYVSSGINRLLSIFGDGATTSTGSDIVNLYTSGVKYLTVVKRADGYLYHYYNGTLLETVTGQIIISTTTTITDINFMSVTDAVLAGQWNKKYYNMMMFGKALTATEISSLVSLGPTLGGMRGYDNGDSTMSVN